MAGEFNKNHPEKKADEVFIGNIQNHERKDVGWKTARYGDATYDVDGKKTDWDRFAPLFVKRSEIEAEGLDPDNM